jgi:oxygen-independent coproporphyrinogen-3 oxidase
MYPPRQAYRELPNGVDVPSLVESSLARSDLVNLYIHVPFCQQICAYCNLYTVARHNDLHRSYITAVTAEIESVASQLAGKTVRTVYVGGGTPSLFEPALLHELLASATRVLGFTLDTVPEVAIEVAPETATASRLADLRQAGFTRVNLGVQSVEPLELASVGRPNAQHTVLRSVEGAMNTGFRNVCVDLIYGLAGQSLETWRRSLDQVIERQPETVCAYPLTLRPGTGFHRRGYRAVDDAEQYRKYDHANRSLREAGYVQETHVRWVIPGRGGYLQKQYHWACEPLVGFGAGARSYLWNLDVRNGYSLQKRDAALLEYMRRVPGRSPVTDGFIMDDDERRRKAVILGLNHLDRSNFRDLYGEDPVDCFPTQLGALFDLGLLEVDDEHLALTELGVRHRDVAVQGLFSERVRSLVESFHYVE